MEDLNSFYTHLKELYHVAGILAEAVTSLATFFNAEAERLTREDRVLCLQEKYVAILKEMERISRDEDAARYNYSKAYLPVSIAGLTAKIIITATSSNPRALNVVNKVFDTIDPQNRPWGTVMVCVGPRGLPEDVRVVSISELARNSKRAESEIIQKLRENGYLILSRESLSRLIDKLVAGAREGRLYLPISSEKLSEMLATGYPRLEAKKIRWVIDTRP